MRQEISPAIVTGAVVLVLLIVALIFWRGLFGSRRVIADPNQMPPGMQRMFTNPAGGTSR